MLPQPDKYGQQYFLVRQVNGQWLAEGEKYKVYSLAFDARNPTKDWTPYFNFILNKFSS